MRSTDVSWNEQARVDAGRLWAGGVATAVVAAFVTLIAIMVLHKLLHAPILSPGGLKQAADYAEVAFPVAAGLITLLATGLLNLLMATTPRASQFFAWIASLGMALIILQVFLHDTDAITKVETTAFYLVIGVAIISSLLGVSRTAVRYHRRQTYRDDYSDRGDYGYRDGGGYRDDRYGNDQYPTQRYPNDRY
jgi:hypothetical protein